MGAAGSGIADGKTEVSRTGEDQRGATAGNLQGLPYLDAGPATA